MKNIIIDSREKGYKIVIDDFNSSHFGIVMANIDKIYRFNSCEVKNIIKELLVSARKFGIQHLTFKLPTDKKNIAWLLGQEKFILVDTLVTYLYDYNKKPLDVMDYKINFRDCTKDDLFIISEIAKNSFKYDRFHTDVNFNNNLCDDYYKNWVINSYKGYADKIIVPILNNRPIGFTTGKLPNIDSKIGKLVLSAVSAESRGRGVYTAMIYEGLKWMNGKASFVQLGTQINNIAVQKAWIKLGFSIQSSNYVFHRNI